MTKYMYITETPANKGIVFKTVCAVLYSPVMVVWARETQSTNSFITGFINSNSVSEQGGRLKERNHDHVSGMLKD